ncbi:NUMOD4 domain-containing protein [Bacteroides sp.]|uniref:NUMOD4 domain-containing protein n=1 Tax=Bacteroides sp. TaxID=29523 RepID=UPI002FC779B9
MKQQPNEVWKDIQGYEGLYQVSNLGRVKTLPRKYGTERIRKPAIEKNGYLQLLLCKDGVRKNYFVHRIVAEAFILNPNNYPTVNHIDKNKLNNQVPNLEWMTFEQNLRYSTKKSVKQLDLKGNVIRIWDSIIDVEKELGYDTSPISKCCQRKPHHHTAYGFKWKYANE